MKKLFLSSVCTFALLALCLSSCGDSDTNIPENPYFGRLYSLQESFDKEISKYREKLPKDGFNSFEERKEFENGEREIIDKYDKKIKEEGKRIVGRTIPLTIEENVPFCIADSLTLISWTGKPSILEASCYIEGEIEATRDIYLAEVGALGGTMPEDTSYTYLTFVLPMYIYHTYGEDHHTLPFEDMYSDHSFNSGYYMSVEMSTRDSSVWIQEWPESHSENYGRLYYRSYYGASECNLPENYDSYSHLYPYSDETLRLPQYDLMALSEVPILRKGERIKIQLWPLEETKALDFSGYKLSFTHPDPRHH